MKSYFYIIFGPIFLILIWGIIAYINEATHHAIVSPLFLASPWAVFKIFIQMFNESQLALDIFSTLERVIIGFIIGAAIGIPLGLVVGYFRKVYDMLEAVIEFFRSTPASAIFPFFILFFGVGDAAKISVAAFSGLLIIFVNTTYGVRHARQLRILAARLMKLGKIAIFWKIILPEAAPHIFAGLRVALSYSMVLIVFSEMFVGTEHGLGKIIIDAQETYKTGAMFMGIILTGLIGYLLNKIVIFFERRVIHWEGKA